MKKLKGAILSQNHRRSQGAGPGVKKAILIPFLQTFLTNIFPKQTFFFKNFPKQFFHFPKQFFPQQTFFPNFTKIVQRLGTSPPDPRL